jgi:hypothetical protein
MGHRVSVVPGGSEEGFRGPGGVRGMKQGFRGPGGGFPWSRGRARHGKQGFRGPGGARGMKNRASGACEAWETGFPWSRGRARHGKQGFRGPGAETLFYMTRNTRITEPSVVHASHAPGTTETLCTMSRSPPAPACEAWETGFPWSRGRTRHEKQGFGGVRGMGNSVSVVPAACEAWKTGFPWSNKKFGKKQTQGDKVWSGLNPHICFPS